MKNKIKEFKEKALDLALNYIETQGEYISPKDLKDLTTTVDIITKSEINPSEDKDNRIISLVAKFESKYEPEYIPTSIVHK